MTTTTSNTSAPQLSTFVKYLALVVLSIGGGSIYVVPYLFGTFGPQLESAMGVSTSTFALVLTAYGLACTILYLPAGMLADKFKSRTLFAFSMISTGILTLAYMAFVTSFAMVVLIHVGFAFTTVLTFWSAFVKAVGTLGPAEEHGQLYGLSEGVKNTAAFLTAFIAAVIVGLFGAGVNYFWDLRSMLFFLAVVYLAVGILAWIILPKEGTGYYPKAAKATRVVGKHYDSQYIAKQSDSDYNAKNITKLFKMPIIWLISFIVLFTMVGYDIAAYRSSYYFLAISGLEVDSDQYNQLANNLSTLSSIRTYLLALIFAIAVGFTSSKVVKNNSVTIAIVSVISAGLALPLLFSSGASNVSGGGMWTLIIFSLLIMFGVAGARAIYWALMGEGKIPAELTGLAIGVISIIGFSKDVWFAFLIGPILENEMWAVMWGLFIFSTLMAALFSIITMIYMKKQTNIIRQETIKSETKTLFGYLNNKVGFSGEKFNDEINKANEISNELFNAQSRIQKLKVLIELEKSTEKKNEYTKEEVTLEVKVQELQTQLVAVTNPLKDQILATAQELDKENKLELDAIGIAIDNSFNIASITTHFAERQPVVFKAVTEAKERINNICYELDAAKAAKDKAKINDLNIELGKIAIEFS